MVLDANILKEKIIDAWKLRSNETSFSASLSPLVAQCQSEEEFRTLFTIQILTHIDAAISSNLIESYFKFHTRSGYINESLVIEHLLSLTPSKPVLTDDIQIKFLLELLYETLQSMHIDSKHAIRLSKNINSLAKWLCSTFYTYSNELNRNDEMDQRIKTILALISKLLLLLFTNSTYYYLCLMIVKTENEHDHWQQIHEHLETISNKLSDEEINIPDFFEQIYSKIRNFYLSDQYYKENIEFNSSIFNLLISSLVINQLHKSSSIILYILRFFENVSTPTNPSMIYLYLLQSSFSGYLSSFATSNSEYQQRWSAYLFFQLPRIFASCVDTNFPIVKESIERFALYNEYLLNRIDELCLENILEQFVQTTLIYTKDEITEKYEDEINQLTFYIQQIRQPYLQQLQQTIQTDETQSSSHEILQLHRTLEKSLQEIFLSTYKEDTLQILIPNLFDYIPLICALDQYYEFIRLLLSYTETQYDLALHILCYVTLIIDDTSEEFGHIELNCSRESSANIVYTWLKKYWLSRDRGHALFSSSLHSTEFLPTKTESFDDMLSAEEDEFLFDVKSFNNENIQIKYSNIQYLEKTVCLLGEIQSLSLEETKNTILKLIHYLTYFSYSSLLHVLLWLIANYQIANDDDKLWIQNVISTLGFIDDTSSTIYSLLDAIKRHLLSNYADNPLIPYYSTISSTSLTSTSSPPTVTLLIQNLYDLYITNEFLECDHTRALFLCSKYLPIDLLVMRLIINSNTSNGIYETNRALQFLFTVILFRRRSSTCSLLEDILPYLFNIPSNEFMIEPNVYTTMLIMNVLLLLEFNQSNSSLEDIFRVKSWRESYIMENNTDSLMPIYEDTSVMDAFDRLLRNASEELFSDDIIRPVNYFFGWFQTIIWMFSRTAKSLKPFIRSKLVTQLSEYLPLQFPVEKVLSMLQFNDENDIEYASMVITRDYTNLKVSGIRTKSMFLPNQQAIISEHQLVSMPTDITQKVFSIPPYL